MELSFVPNKTPCLVRKDLTYLGSLKCAGCKHFVQANLRDYVVVCKHKKLTLWQAIVGHFKKKKQVKHERKTRS